MAKLRASHCSVNFSVELVTERPTDEERYVRCIMCGERIAHSTDSDADRWEHLQSLLPDEPPIKLLKILITEYFKTNRADSFIEFYHRKIKEIDDAQEEEHKTSD